MSKKTLLIVDDSKENITILLSLLNQYDVLVALNGAKALKMVEKHHIDMVLLDIVMPQMDGYEVCKILKSQKETHNIPILFITSSNDEASIDKAFRIGGSDYISKPFKPVELLARVKMHLILSETVKSLKYMATRDSMTGIYNRGKFFELAETLFGEHRQLCAMMIDIDKFKNINDTYGHPFGDIVIKAVAQTIQENLSDEMIFGRLGGEEFGILCSSLAIKDRINEAEKLKESIEALIWQEANETVSVTISIGVAQTTSEKTLDMLLHKADKALYEAKESGRNRVCSRK